MLSLVLTASLGLSAEDVHAAKFTERGYIEIEFSTDMLDLGKDFTIEIWARWQGSDRSEYIAGDEAWPGMAADVVARVDCGWVLRKMRENGQDVLDFNVGTRERSWFSLKSPIPRNSDWQHIAICRLGDELAMFLDGKPIALTSLRGVTLLTSPTPLYLGSRKSSLGDRRFNGEIREFRVSSVARYRRQFKPTPKFKKDTRDLVHYDFQNVDEKEDGTKVVRDISGLVRHGLLKGVSVATTGERR